MTWAMIAFFALLAVGVGFGIVRDVASTDEGVIDGTVVDTTSPGGGYRWPTTPPSIKVKLASGTVESVYTRHRTAGRVHRFRPPTEGALGAPLVQAQGLGDRSCAKIPARSLNGHCGSTG
jgi:hypothetical protein